MNFLSNILKTLGPRLIGSAVAGIAGWIFTKTQGAVSIDANTVTQQVTVMVAGYAVAHRIASSQLNPGDSATGRVADAVQNAADTGTTVKVAPKID